jgi:hypothetical protein
MSTRKQWKTRTGADLKLSPAQFIKEYYAKEIADGILNMAFVRREDLSLYKAFNNWRRYNKDVPLEFPFPPARRPRDAGQALHDARASARRGMQRLRARRKGAPEP